MKQNQISKFCLGNDYFFTRTTSGKVQPYGSCCKAEGGLMGSGESGRYYTSHGSNRVHHGALIHSFDGRFTRNPRTGKIQNIKSGGHGESALEVMGKNGIKYNIVKTYLNGVRVGNIPSIKDRAKKQGTGMAWFPKTWTTRNMVRAGEHVSGLKHNRGVKDGVIIWETYKGVRVGVIKTNGQVATVFPDARYQPVRKNGRKR